MCERVMRQLLVGVMIFLGITVPLFAGPQAGQPIRGFVVDETNGEPLPVANVSVVGTSRGSSTNLDGFFLIPAMSPGSYTLQVNYLGYQMTEYEVQVTSEVMSPIKIELKPASFELQEVVYVAEDEDDDAKRESPRVSTVPVDAAAIRAMPALGAEMDVLRAVQAIPGVKASSELSSAPVVRGGSPDMTLILMDQSTVYNPSHMFGIFSTFNGDAVKRLELMKGGFPAEYGGRAGSVLEVTTNDGNRKETEGLVSVGVVAARAALEGPLGNERGSYAISGRRTYFEPALAVMREAFDTDLPDYYFYDGNGKVNFDITPKTTLTVGGYIGLDELDFEFGSDDARALLTTYWGNRTATSRLRHVVGDNAFLTIGLNWSRYRSGAEFWSKNPNTGEDVLIQDFKNRFNDLNLRGDYEYLGWENHKFKTGFMYSSLNTDVINQTEETTYVSIDTTTSNISGYVQDQWRLNALWEIMPGLRTTYHQDGDLLLFDPRFAVVYHQSPEMRFKAAAGRYHQFVNVISAGEALSFFDIWVPADGSVDPTYMDQFVLGWEWDFNRNHEVTIETYYNNMGQVLEYNMNTDEANSLAQAFLQGEGRAYGAEFMVRRKHGRITGWLGYSLSWSERRFPGSEVNNGDWYFPKYDRRHDFMAVVLYDINDRWSVSGQWRYNTGQGYTEAKAWMDYTLDGAPQSSLPNNGISGLYGAKNNYRLPADHRLDISADYKHHFFGLPAKATLSLYNAYNRRAIFTRNYDKSENPPVANDVKLLPILPLVGYEVRF
ncbi:TonB-dependent receptor [bacterium]|nr:TonB-dependent receptor [bacterium]